MNKKISKDPVIFVSGILERIDNGVKKIFLQTRWKPKISPIYSGLLEIPGGRINNYENVFDAITREVKEECGLNIIKFWNGFRGELVKISQFDQSMVFQPFICQQVLPEDNGRVWFGFVFLCEVEGESKTQKGETKDPQWVTFEELKRLLDEQPEKIFPHQYQALRYYVDSMK